MNYGGTLIINNSTISENRMGLGYSGSAINNVATLILNNTTISGNRGPESIYNFVGTVTINNTTVTNNDSGLTNVGGMVTLHNTILAGNNGFDCYNNSNGYNGTVTSLGFNLIQTKSGCTFIGGDLASDPIFGMLQNNGGFSPDACTITYQPSHQCR